MKRALLFLLALAAHAHAQSTISPANPFAWGANIGWLNARPSAADGVSIGEYVCRGFAWSANCGWLNFGGGTPQNGIAYANNSATDFGVNVMPGGSLRGFAFGANIGWVQFEPQGDPRVDYATGKLTGYAWGANVGWIHLGDVAFGVVAQSIAPGADSDGDGIADAWELQHAGNLQTLSATGDQDHDGLSDRDEYFADSDPLDPSTRFRITNLVLDFDPVVEFTLTFTSSASRSFIIESSTNLSPGSWSDVGFGTFSGINGLHTGIFGGASGSARRLGKR